MSDPGPDRPDDSRPAPADDPYATRPGEPHPGRPRRWWGERERQGVRDDEPGPGDDGERDQRDPPRPGKDHRTPPDPDALRRVRSLVFLSAAAAIAAVAWAPLGLALGVVTLVLAYRRRGDARNASMSAFAAAVPVAGGIFAVVVGGIFSLAMAIFGSEMSSYQQCVAGANTHMAEQRCQDELLDALEDRLR